MTFRREQDPLFAWRKRNAHRLTELGIPEAIVSDHNRFLLAVQNGEDQDSKWNSSWIEKQNVSELLSLLSEKFDNVGWDLIRALERR